VVNISGGRLAGLLSVIDSEVNVSGGSGRIEAFGGEVNISGGSSVFVSAQPGTVVNLSDGSIGSGFTATAGSEVNISGGSVGAIFNAALDSVVNISGGTFESGEFFNGAFGRFFHAQHFSNVNLFGSEFVLDGVLLDDSLTIDNAFTIVDRDVTLSGVLADGSPFSFLLNSRPSSDGSVTDLFRTTATLTVTLVSSAPELGDVNLDGEITFADIGPFIAALQAGTFLEQADCNQDGVVDFADIASFIEILQAG